LVVTAGARPGSDLERWLRARLAGPARGVRLSTPARVPPGWRGRARPALLRAALGTGERPAGQLVLLGRGGRGGLTRDTLPAGLPAEIGVAVEQVWRLHRRTLRLTVLNDLAALMSSTRSLDRVYATVGQALGRLIDYDALVVILPDRGGEEPAALRIAHAVLPAGRPWVLELDLEARLPTAGWTEPAGAVGRLVRRVDHPADRDVPAAVREWLARHGARSAVLAVLRAEERLAGALVVMHRDSRAFGEADEEVLAEVARPLASAVEYARLHAETAERAEALAALNRTSQLITGHLDLGEVLDAISRSVTALIGSTGCGIGLLTPDRAAVQHVAAHGFTTPEWQRLSMAVSEGIIGRVAESGIAVRVDDVRAEPRSAQPDVDEKEGIRSMLSVPLRVGGETIGVISAFARVPGFFAPRHQALLESFADQAGIAIQNARLFEESLRRTRQTQALLEAGRAVSQSLEVGETIRVILHQAREVLGVTSCGLMTLDESSGELVQVASLDLDAERVGQIRLQVGEGVTGQAVALRRPVQSDDLAQDPRVRYSHLPREAGLRSMLAAPLLVGDRAIGALTVLRSDAHHFTPDEESLVSAFADQAAIALEHARLFSSVRTYSERLEAMVAARTRELDEQKRFVEVVLETLPLGLYVLDGQLRVVSANREGALALAWAPGPPRSFLDLLPEAAVAAVQEFLASVWAAPAVRQVAQELALGGEARTFRLTAAPLRGAEARASHLVLLVEDITLQKQLERRMLLSERLSTAGRLAAGVAHELNNPLATIAGCAEALRERALDPALQEVAAFKDFPSYLSLIEDESYRCKEITGSLLQLVRDPGSRRSSVDLNALVEKTLEVLRHQSRFAGSRMAGHLDPGLPPVIANEGQLRQVLIGLSANALEAMDGKGALTVTTRRAGAAEVEVEFADEGPGIAPEILPRIFDPFFTTKPSSQGTGLGLAIAQGIVADHDGRIEVRSRPGLGATFRVILPGAGAARREETGP
ncbi:MAG: GAF domain-containing protein, partial [Candidatus Rokubacteria bacterium]|nr:GAF domain-containing protein [Candidatus Rokubacteria bacterium]